MKTFTAYVEWDPDTELYVGIVPGVTGAHSQASTLHQLRSNLREVLKLCLEEERTEAPDVQGGMRVELELREAPYGDN